MLGLLFKVHLKCAIRYLIFVIKGIIMFILCVYVVVYSKGNLCYSKTILFCIYLFIYFYPYKMHPYKMQFVLSMSKPS